MRVAALYDVHGNLPALEAVLTELERTDAEGVVVGGDIVLGPFPRDTLELLLSLGERAHFLRGNCDREPGEHAAAQLTSEQLDFLAGLPLTLSLEVDGLGDVLFCHASPRSDEELFTRLSPGERVHPMLAGVSQSLVVCGHTHIQFDRAVASKRIVNAGSVGMPYEREPGAYWALLDRDVELRHTPYDLETAAERIAASGYPNADEWAREYVYAVNDPEAATRYFEELASGQA